jgi:hypothetical protein
MPIILTDLLDLLGFITRFIGFLVFGFAIGRFVWDNFKTSEWQVKIALILGFLAWRSPSLILHLPVQRVLLHLAVA